MFSRNDDYRIFAETAPDLPVFMQGWYLDAVCGGAENWHAVLAEKGGRIVAAMPFFLKKLGPWRYVAMPPLTKMLGPYVLPEFRNTRHEPALVGRLIEQLPRLAAFEQDFNYHLANWLPFYHRGFRQTTRYSYTLKINDLEKTWQGIGPDYRRKIRNAGSLVRVRPGEDLAEMLRLQNLTFARQGLDAPISLSFLEKLDAALAARQARQVFFAEDRETGAVHSTQYLIWDKTACYMLLAGDDPALRASGAGVLTTWESIQFARNTLNLNTFDFAGSMLEPIARVRRRFGAEARPYFRVQREGSWLWRLGKAVRG